MNAQNKKILISMTAHMGDFIWATSAFAILKKTYPEIEITVLAPESIKELIEKNPVIDKVIYSPFSNNDAKSRVKKLFWAATVIPKIFIKNFDSILIFDSSKISVLIAKFARIKHIVGGDLFFAGFDILDPLSKFYTRIIALPKDQDAIHASARFQIIVKNYFEIYNNAMPVLPNSSHCAKNAQELLQNKNNINVALCIKGSKNTSHVWDIGNFEKIINYLTDKYNNIDFYIVGAKNDYGYAQQIKLKNVRNICGKTTLLNLREFFKLTDLLISLDTGVIHLAATTDINIISLHGATSPATTGPMSSKAVTLWTKTDCALCSLKKIFSDYKCPTYPQPKCLELIKPETVTQEAIKILDTLKK
ncbi:glycosyltransferase family 9 protein [Endomicrobium proavitum]|uniref:ADP-heptose:LPS heptosyltransferase II n=1 Tax=Endomicrobium proavitum TaxID=1408281 RepID=A0A0G3WGB6_9BACT|nr:glycosyltransferase family 9 protein [Endomicrobium proavitum]AKL97701.1 ADP-heptose:LPS heptosyltransferase II [Endomicrobium proavitum]